MRRLALALSAALLATAAAPALKPLSAKALHRMLNGRSISEARPRVAGAGPEIFCADGRWTWRIERVQRAGRWRVEDGRVCIDTGDRFPNCRHAFVDRGGRLWLAPDGAPSATRAYTVVGAASPYCAVKDRP